VTRFTPGVSMDSVIQAVGRGTGNNNTTLTTVCKKKNS